MKYVRYGGDILISKRTNASFNPAIHWCIHTNGVSNLTLLYIQLITELFYSCE